MKKWLTICHKDDILPNMGRGALITEQNQQRQIAIFKIVDLQGNEQFYALDNFCPFSNTNTLSRGITGDINGQLVVASPLYKQHFNLKTGQCLEDETITVNTYSVRCNNEHILIAVKASVEEQSNEH